MKNEIFKQTLLVLEPKHSLFLFTNKKVIGV